MDETDSPSGGTTGNNAGWTSRPSNTATASPSAHTQPVPHNHRVPSPERSPRAPVSADLRDATELGTITPEARNRSPSTISSGSVRVVTRQPSQSSAQSRGPMGRLAPIKTFWKRNVVLSVAQSQSRDHFALERTFLAYIRTSTAFSMLGVFIAQLFILHHTKHPDPVFGFFRVGVPLSCACFGVAIVVALIGAHRFWRQQSAMANSKVHAGGWELNVIGVLTTAIVVVGFALVVAISSRKE